MIVISAFKQASHSLAPEQLPSNLKFSLRESAASSKIFEKAPQVRINQGLFWSESITILDAFFTNDSDYFGHFNYSSALYHESRFPFQSARAPRKIAQSLAARSASEFSKKEIFAVAKPIFFSQNLYRELLSRTPKTKIYLDSILEIVSEKEPDLVAEFLTTQRLYSRNLFAMPRNSYAPFAELARDIILNISQQYDLDTGDREGGFVLEWLFSAYVELNFSRVVSKFPIVFFRRYNRIGFTSVLTLGSYFGRWLR